MNTVKHEVWKPAKGYEGLYDVSNMGNVRNRNGLILKARQNNSGYLYVHLSKLGKQKYYLVHRLVAAAFIENTRKMPCVNHLDENKANNEVYNLEWCSHKENNNYSTHNDNVSKSRSKRIQAIKNGTVVARYDSAKHAERITGFDQGNICKCCNGIRKTAYGYVWSYEDDVKCHQV